MGAPYDVAVVGAGPGGCTAALYCARAGLRTLLLERLSAGGQMASTSQVDNYPGFDQGVDGFQLGERMLEGARHFGAQFQLAQVTGAQLDGPVKVIFTSEGDISARCVIIATGADPRKLGLPGEEKLISRGVHYCAACDGMAYRGRDVAVVGGGDSAAGEALLLSQLCRRVTLIHRRDRLRAAQVYRDALTRRDNLTFCWNCIPVGLLQKDRFTGVLLRDLSTGEERPLPCDGLFVSIGRTPGSAPFLGQVAADPAGYLLADESTCTSLPGVFAAGDVRTKAVRQIVTATADGAAAAHAAESYLTGTLPL